MRRVGLLAAGCLLVVLALFFEVSPVVDQLDQFFLFQLLWRAADYPLVTAIVCLGVGVAGAFMVAAGVEPTATKPGG